VPRGIWRLEQVLDAIDRHAPPRTIYGSMRDLADSLRQDPYHQMTTMPGA
jgi:hypothetical protein